MNHDPADWRIGLELLQGCFCFSDGRQFRIPLVSIRIRQGFEGHLLDLDALHEFHARLHFEFADVAPHEYRTIGISLSIEATGSSQHRTELLPGPNTVSPWMLHFALESDHGPDVVPARVLPDGEDVAVVERQDRKSTRLNSSHLVISYAVFCLKK